MSSFASSSAPATRHDRHWHWMTLCAKASLATDRALAGDVGLAHDLGVYHRAIGIWGPDHPHTLPFAANLSPARGRAGHRHRN